MWRALLHNGPIRTFRIMKGFIKREVTNNLSICREMFFTSKEFPEFDPAIEGDDDALKNYMERFSQIALPMNMRPLKDEVRRREDNASIPTLSVCGTKDVIRDIQGARAGAEMWDGELVMVDGAPQDLMLYSEWERPASVVRDWLSNRFPTTV